MVLTYSIIPFLVCFFFFFFKWGNSHKVAPVWTEAGVRVVRLTRLVGPVQEDDPHTHFPSPTVCAKMWSLWDGVAWRWAKALQDFPINCTVIYYLKLRFKKKKMKNWGILFISGRLNLKSILILHALISFLFFGLLIHILPRIPSEEIWPLDKNT